MIYENNSLRIHFDLGENTLYDLGYLSIDIYQLIVFCNLIEENNQYDLEKYFFNNRSRFGLHRFDDILVKNKSSAKIEHLKDGSIDMFITGVGVLSPIIIAYVVYKAQINAQKYSEEITFNIGANDEELINLIDEVGQGTYGFEDDGLKYLFRALERRGISYRAISNNVYEIDRVISNYQQRISRTIKKYIK